MLKRLLILSIIFLIGCTVGQYWDYYFPFPYANEIVTVDDAHYWVRFNMDYISDEFEEWKLPEETFNDGGGDCEDLAIFMMYLCYEYVEETPTMFRVEIPNIGKHMIVEVDQQLYDPHGIKYGHIDDFPFPILNSYTYGETIYLAAYVK